MIYTIRHLGIWDNTPYLIGSTRTLEAAKEFARAHKRLKLIWHEKDQWNYGRFGDDHYFIMEAE